MSAEILDMQRMRARHRDGGCGAVRGLVSEMASRKGFEPLTPGLGNLCSILLSYRDVIAVFA